MGYREWMIIKKLMGTLIDLDLMCGWKREGREHDEFMFKDVETW